MPKMIAMGVAGMLAVSAGLYALAGAGSSPPTATVPAVTVFPVKPFCLPSSQDPNQNVYVVLRRGGLTCYTTTMPYENPVYWGSYVGLSDIGRAYELAGYKTATLKGGLLRVTFPGNKWRVLSPAFSLAGQGYIETSQLISSTLREKVTPELSLSGYSNPTLSFGTLRLRLGTDEQPVVGMDFYWRLMPTFVGVLTSPNLGKGWGGSINSFNHRNTVAKGQQAITLQTGLKPDEVVMLMTSSLHQQPGSKVTTYFADVARVDRSGRARLLTQGQRLRFVNQVGDLRGAVTAEGRPAVLVRVTGVSLRDLKSGIFLPK